MCIFAFFLHMSIFFCNFVPEMKNGMKKAGEWCFRFWSYALYLLRSRNTLGYGIHSPFLFYIARTILPERAKYYCFAEIEGLRRELLRSKEEMRVEDFGTGESGVRRVSEVARVALKGEREAQVLFRIVNMLKAERIVELGTSLGITTAYLAKPHKEASVLTFEGSRALLEVAKRNWKRLGIANIRAIEGNIDETLEGTLGDEVVDVALIDANHRKEATLKYFDVLVRHAGEKSVFVVDDIRYSKEMWEAWRDIEERRDVTARMDLGTMGLVFFDPHFPKQTFRIRL